MALAHNQEVAEQIANKLRHSGQMSDYKIGVKYQDGTAWLRGRVSNQDQMNTAIRTDFPNLECQPGGQQLDGCRLRPASSVWKEKRIDGRLRRCRRAKIRCGRRRLTPRRPNGRAARQSGKAAAIGQGWG